MSAAIARHLGIDLSPEGRAARNRCGIGLIIHGAPVSGKCFSFVCCLVQNPDTQIYVSLASQDTENTYGLDCLCNVVDWMTESKLKPHADKTEFLIIGTQKQCDKFYCIFPTPIVGQNISPMTSTWNLEVIFFNNFNFLR